MDNCNKTHNQNTEVNSSHSQGCVLVKASSIKPQSVKWLWPNRIPLGMLFLLAGRGGVGKSTVALSIAAIVTQGGSWPLSNDRTESGDVLIMTAEDRLSHVQTPRLIAAGADLEKIHFLTGVPRTVGKQSVTEQFSIKRHASRLSHELTKNPAIKLVIIDPLAAFLDVNDAHRDADVRQALGPLNQVADEHNVAIILIAHVNKGQGHDARERVSGSIAIVNAVRMAYLAHEDGELNRVFVPFKSNVSRSQNGLVYKIEGRTWSEHGDESGCAVWLSETTKSADSILAADDKPYVSAPARHGAEIFLTQLLTDGPVAAKEIFRQGKEVGISRSTLYRAKDNLNIRAEKEKFDGGWLWHLPLNQKVTSATSQACKLRVSSGKISLQELLKVNGSGGSSEDLQAD